MAHEDTGRAVRPTEHTSETATCISQDKCSNQASASFNNKASSKTEKIFGLQSDEIYPEFRTPFILTGYRKPNIKASECVQSAFVNCNETVNIWTHFIPFLLFFVKFYELYSTSYSISDPATWPLLSGAIGICGFCIASTIAHTFYSMSLSAKDCCFCVDYAAISVYSVGLGQAFYFYGRPLQPEILIYETEWPFIILSILTSISSTFLCCLTTRFWQHYKFVVRTFSMIAPFLVNSWPLLHRMITCSNNTDCLSSTTIWYYQIHCFLFILSGIVNVFRFPENVFPRVFDFIGQSHNLMHVGVAVGAWYQFDAIHLDMIARRRVLTLMPVQCSVWNTIVPFIASIIINFGIAFAFGSRSIKEKEYRRPKKE